MQNSPSESLTTRNKGEIINPFELAKKLFDFAAENLSESAGWRYSDLNGEYEDNPYAKELPEMFHQIIADYPGRYYVVSYENRTSSDYALGTRMKYVRLSTVPKLSQSNDLVREIGISEPHVSEGRGNVLVISIKDSVMNRDVQNINTAKEGETDSPRGSAKFTYETNPIGDKKLIGLNFERMDEGIFTWQEKQTPVRWLRYLDIERPDTENTKTQYRDLYIIGRHHQREDGRDMRVDVRFMFTGNIDTTKDITISIGLDMGGKGETLFENSEQNVKIVFHNMDPWATKEDTLAILRQDPNYSSLLRPDVSREIVIDLLKNKTRMMTEDWNKASAVFNHPFTSSPNVLI